MYPAVSEDQIFNIKIIEASKVFQDEIEKKAREIIVLSEKVRNNKEKAIKKLENYILDIQYT